MKSIAYRQARPDDAAALADIRVAAMRPSLEAIGRFDKDRARQRFLSTFDPLQTTLVLQDAQIVGFFVVRDMPDHIWLDHLYVSPDQQGKGLGRYVMRELQSRAAAFRLPIELMALRDSPANAFYTSLGFVQVREDTFDIYYRWHADPAPERSFDD